MYMYLIGRSTTSFWVFEVILMSMWKHSLDFIMSFNWILWPGPGFIYTSSHDMSLGSHLVYWNLDYCKILFYVSNYLTVIYYEYCYWYHYCYCWCYSSCRCYICLWYSSSLVSTFREDVTDYICFLLVIHFDHRWAANFIALIQLKTDE